LAWHQFASQTTLCTPPSAAVSYVFSKTIRACTCRTTSSAVANIDIQYRLAPLCICMVDYGGALGPYSTSTKISA
jgi:hypothetical protein